MFDIIASLLNRPALIPENNSWFSTLFLKKTSRIRIQLLRYLFVGGIAALIDTGVFIFFTVRFDSHYLIAQTFGFIAGITANYLLSIAWIFKQSRQILPEVGLFLITGIIGLFLSYLLLFIFIDILHITAFENIAAKILTIALVLIWNFTSRKFFVFKQQNI